MSRFVVCFALIASTGFAQKRGAPPVPQSTAEEKMRAQTAAEWADVIERARANAPQHPPDHDIKFPTKSETFIATLKYVEQPKEELDRQLKKVWQSSTDPTARWTALENLWQAAPKPLWIRPAIESFFRERSNGVALHPTKAVVDKPVADAPKS